MTSRVKKSGSLTATCHHKATATCCLSHRVPSPFSLAAHPALATSSHHTSMLASRVIFLRMGMVTLLPAACCPISINQSSTRSKLCANAQGSSISQALNSLSLPQRSSLLLKRISERPHFKGHRASPNCLQKRRRSWPIRRSTPLRLRISTTLSHASATTTSELGRGSK